VRLKAHREDVSRVLLNAHLRACRGGVFEGVEGQKTVLPLPCL
jgi:hypothetical protein